MKIKKHLSITIITLWIINGLLSISGCGIYTEISVTSDETVNFYKYKTFAWLQDNIDTPDVLLQVVIANKKKEKEVYYPSHPKPFYYCPYYYCSPYYSPYIMKEFPVKTIDSKQKNSTGDDVYTINNSVSG